MPIIDFVAGARPNFMKLAPVLRAMQKHQDLQPRVVHTGQHYDPGMNEVFFKQLDIPAPDIHLNVGSGTHGLQTARILELYEAHLLESPPSATVVFGDVNSTVACALAAVKLNIPVFHVEAGLRSFDRSMPEEVNRLVTDCLSDILFVSEPSGLENLKTEGIDDEKVYLVGNVMIDTLKKELEIARGCDILERFGVQKGNYGLITLHRPSNVDTMSVLNRILELLVKFSKEIPLVFPIHPRTQAAIDRNHIGTLLADAKNIRCAEPLPYHENLCLMANAKFVMTDSGGMQEETSFLGVPCLTLRENTERPITVSNGTSKLLSNDPGLIQSAFENVMAHKWPEGAPIPLWDGNASERIADIIADQMRD